MGYYIKNTGASINLLYPLLDIPKSIHDKKMQTYLFWKQWDTDIYNNMFFVLFKCDDSDEAYNKFEKDNIMSHKYLQECLSTEKGKVFVFSMWNYEDTVTKFIKGKYSQFSEDVKLKILKYKGEVKLTKKCSLNNNGFPTDPFNVILYPKEYLCDIAEELKVPCSYMGKSGESFSAFNRETTINSFDGSIINNYIETLDAEITDKCVINYNQLVLNL